MRVDLYRYSYSRCRECFLCKMDNDKFYAKCNFKDGITPVLGQLEGIDGIVSATLVFYDDISGQLKSFLERFLFPKDSWQKPREILFDRHIFMLMQYTITADIYYINTFKLFKHDTFWGANGWKNKNGELYSLNLIRFFAILLVAEIVREG